MTPVTQNRPSPRLVRGSAIAGLGVLALLHLWIRGSWYLASGPTAFGEAVYLAPIVLAFAGILFLLPRTRSSERRFWALLAIATGLLLAAATYFSYYVLVVDSAGPPVVSGPQLLSVGALVAVLAIVLLEANFGSAGAVVRLRYFSGALAGVLAVYIVVYDLLVAPLLEGSGGFAPETIAASAVYPVVGIVLVVGIGGAVFGWNISTWPTWELLAGGALSFTAIGIAAMPWWLAGYDLTGPRLWLPAAEAGLALGPYLLFLSAVYRLTEDDHSDALASRPRLDSPPPWLHVAYPMALALAVPAFGFHAVTHAGTPRAVVIFGVDVMLAVVLLARSWFSALELQRGRRVSFTDAVTGLKDERSLKRDLEASATEAARWGGDVAFVALDIDDLSRVNELFGHRSGDQVLSGVANVLREHCGVHCQLYRAGSDEFAIVAPGESSESAAQLAEDLARRVEQEVTSGDFPITVSAGVTALSVSKDYMSMIRDAFSALQSAKIVQRGSVVVFGEDTVKAYTPEERLDLARKEAYRATVRALAAAVDARDPSSREHSRRVGAFARELALELGATAAQASAIETSGLVHDIGKLALPDELLWKHGTLDENELARLREHVDIGERILNSTDLVFIQPWVRAHHERWDGAGYPDGLAGEQIPREARILAVCDAYDAMVSGMSAPAPMGGEQALAEIEQGAGTQFDPAVADAFVRLRLRVAPWAAPPQAEES